MTALVLLALFLPLAGALAATSTPNRPRVRLALILASLGLSVFALAIVPVDTPFPVLGGTSVVFTPLSRILDAVLHVLVAVISVAARRASGPFLAYALLTFGASTAALNVDSFFVSVLLLQLAMLVSILMLLEPPRPHTAVAISRYLTLSFLAGVLLIVSLILVEGFQVNAENRQLAQALTAILILGFAIKLAAPPLHLWLPEMAATARPAAVGLVVTVPGLALFGLAARLFGSFPSVLLDAVSSGLLVTGATVAVVLGTVMLIAQRDLGRMLGFGASYATGFSLLGIGLGNRLGLTGGILHAIASALALALVALSVDAIEQATDSLQIVKLSGIARSLPFSSAGLLLGTLSLAGLPPFAGFSGLWLLLEASARRGPGWTAVLLICSAVAIGYFAVVAQRLLFGSETAAHPGREPLESRAAVALLTAIILVMGLAPQPLINALLDALARLPLYRVS